MKITIIIFVLGIMVFTIAYFHDKEKKLRFEAETNYYVYEKKLPKREGIIYNDAGLIKLICNAKVNRILAGEKIDNWRQIFSDN